ncbi:retropepsin-like aspartic protease [Lutimonas zeaxanthinifaciens]|uniref:retropepsin-like aspartic protease n=1 Tax=Lutimonas zeaxanthinifaciens TaxID=3060215 RepID=UPI00265D4D6A|nr:retropepsin-like aspartic protease [Lutimonas sp. YSD2104]WKK66580.1 retropepsin-like aspartic protease [Lutimonas sp. YSD2104]
MQDLKEFLFEQGYVRVKLKKTITNHFEIKAKINGIKGNFILDTGASKSCVGIEDIEHFNLKTEASEEKASGAGPSEIDTLISAENKVAVGKFKMKKMSLILIDLSHINKALEKQEADPVKGILGADILIKGKSIIDYNKKYLYLLNKKN